MEHVRNLFRRRSRGEQEVEHAGEASVLAVCAVCQRPVREGERVVSIVRNLEQIEPGGMVRNVLDSVELAVLCEACGLRYPEERIRLHFE